ncbi:MAG TPA: hypothetical protein PLV57_22475 [Phycisphaerae bacterium]|nr:hypothetical protein [Phycisphaerae bacterium]HPP29279.1 hypothetical protein [Phycisphaerae bacterium]
MDETFLFGEHFGKRETHSTEFILSFSERATHRLKARPVQNASVITNVILQAQLRNQKAEAGGKMRKPIYVARSFETGSGMAGAFII